jgi:hypothetical protein
MLSNEPFFFFPGVREGGNTVTNQVFFDTLRISPAMDQGEIQHRARQKQINLRYYPDETVYNFSFLKLTLQDLRQW